MFFNKKGMSQEVLVGFVLVALALVIYLLFLTTLKSSTNSASEKEICKLSVEANSKRLEFKGVEVTPGLSDLKCPTQKVTIKDPEKIKLILANEMYDCWDQFGQGKIKFLDTDTNTYCAICSKVSFEGNAQNKQLDGFINYLADTRIRDNSNIPITTIDYTYLRFLTDYENTPDLLNNIKITQTDRLDTSSPYAIMFLYYKQQTFGRIQSAQVFALTPCITASLAIFGISATGAGVAALPLLMPIGGAACGPVGITASAVGGFMIGSDHSADWGARVVTVPYSDIDKLGCTELV